MNKEFERIINTYEIKELSNDLKVVETVENIFIGVLGEFSSGKSSMLNSILGKKILPAMDKPTTKSITYLKADTNQENEIEYFEIKEDDSEEKISLIEYQDIAKGNRSGEAVVSVKNNDFLNKGYVFVDTPGVSSLDQTDIDITYGLLPKLDGILICIDCNTGSLNASLKSFLQNPNIESIKDKILFVLTKSDHKGLESMDKIIEGFKTDINNYLKIDDIDNRIVSFSSENVLEKKDNNDVEKLLNLFDISINSRKKQMLELRLKKKELVLKNKIIDALRDLKSKLNFDNSEFLTERNLLENDIESLKKQRFNLKNKLVKFEDSLEEELKIINNNFSSKIKNECSNLTPNDANLNTLFTQYSNQVSNVISSSIELFFKNNNFIEPNSLNIDFSEISMSIVSVLKSKETLTSIVTSAVIAAATGGTSLVANAAETGGAMVVQSATKAATKIGIKTALKNSAKNIALGFIKNLSSIVKEVNPIEHLGAFFAKNKIKSSLELQLPEMSKKVCNQTLNSIKNQIENVYDEIDERLKIHEKNIDLAFEKMKKGKGEIEILKSKIEGELINLS